MEPIIPRNREQKIIYIFAQKFLLELVINPVLQIIQIIILRNSCSGQLINLWGTPTQC